MQYKIVQIYIKYKYEVHKNVRMTQKGKHLFPLWALYEKKKTLSTLKR